MKGKADTNLWRIHVPPHNSLLWATLLPFPTRTLNAYESKEGGGKMEQNKGKDSQKCLKRWNTHCPKDIFVLDKTSESLRFIHAEEKDDNRCLDVSIDLFAYLFIFKQILAILATFIAFQSRILFTEQSLY